MSNNDARRVPDFIAVGPPRTATTWLDVVLRGHVGLPAHTKETHFFARNYARGIDWYARHFRHCVEEPVVGEICASYFENIQARERIHAHMPGCKIICTLRDPVDRLYSYYRLMRQKGRTALSFEKAVLKHRQMLDCSRYVFHVRDWQEKFGADNVLVVLNDDLSADPQNYLDSITNFIGIPRITLTDTTATRRDNTIETAPRSVWIANRARKFRFWLGSRQFYRASRFLKSAGVWRLCFEGGEKFSLLAPGVKAPFRAQLKPEIEALEPLLRRDLSQWKGTRGRILLDGNASHLTGAEQGT